MTHQPKLERLSIVFDADHGTQHEGWYVRMIEESTYERAGSEIDEPVNLDIPEEPSKRQESTLRAAARRVARRYGYRVPSGLAVEIR